MSTRPGATDINSDRERVSSARQPQFFKFERLEVWHLALAIFVDVSAVADTFPAVERFGLGAQLRSSALSVSANIAEGTGRPGAQDSRRFFGIAKASTYEVVSLLAAARRRELIDTTRHEALYAHCHQIARMLSGLLRK